MSAVFLGFIAALVSLVLGCRTEISGMVLVSANESLSTMQITGPSFANGAGPWIRPNDYNGTFLEFEADNTTASSVQLVIRVGSTGTSADEVVFRVPVDAGSKLYTTVLCRFNEPYPESFKAWHDGSEGVADLTGVNVTAIPLYWLVDQ